MTAVAPTGSLELLYEDAPCGHLSTSLDGRIVRVNRTLLRWTGFTHDALTAGDTRAQDLLTPGGRAFFEVQCEPLLRLQGMVREIALEVVCADGRTLPVLLNAVVHHDDLGRPALVQMTLLEATERRQYERELLAARDAERDARRRAEELSARLATANAELERLVRIDPTTGVPNRRALQEQLRSFVARADRDGTGFGVALLDIDHFKRVNDTYGHETGDAVLGAVAAELRDTGVRQDDIVGRWGGEEFLIISTESSPDALVALCERARRAVSGLPMRHDDETFHVTASLGCTTWTDEDVGSLIRRADEALYRAKDAGRDRVVAGPAPR